MEELCVLQKNGMYYGHNSCGYVHLVLNAELYEKAYAELYAEHHKDVRAVAVVDLLTSADEVQEYIDRLFAMKKAMEHKS